MKKLILIGLWIFVFAAPSFAVPFAPDTRAWFDCHDDAQCVVVEGPCDWISVNTSSAQEASEYYIELQKLVECAGPGNQPPAPNGQCRSGKCVIEERPVAKVFDQFIYPSDLVPPAEVLERNRTQMPEDEFTQWKKSFELTKLEFLIFSRLQTQLLDESRMQPTPEEIEALAVFLKQQDEKRLHELEAQRSDLQAHLHAADLTELKKQTLNEYLDVAEQLIESEQRRIEEEKMIPNYVEIKKKSLGNVSAVTVTAWKFNKALYQKFGGRVIFQQAGWEPVDAYKTFLENHRTSKSFEVLDPAYSQTFNRMFEYFKREHLYMEKEKADQYFALPWWDPAFKPL